MSVKNEDKVIRSAPFSDDYEHDKTDFGVKISNRNMLSNSKNDKDSINRMENSTNKEFLFESSSFPNEINAVNSNTLVSDTSPFSAKDNEPPYKKNISSFDKSRKKDRQLEFPSFDDVGLENVKIAQPVSSDASGPSEKNEVLHSFNTGDLIEVVFQKTKHVLGIVLSRIEENNSLSVLLWSNKDQINGMPGFSVRTIMPFTVKYKAKNWLFSVGLSTGVVDEILSIPSRTTENTDLKLFSLSFPAFLVPALKKFEANSLQELEILLKQLPQFEKKFIFSQSNSSSNAWSPRRFLLEFSTMNYSKTDPINKSTFLSEKLGCDSFSYEQAHAAYRLLFYNSKYFVKPPFLGPDGPYFLRSLDELSKINQLFSLSKSSVEKFREKLLGHIENWRRSLSASIASFSVAPNLTTGNFEYSKIYEIFSTESDRLLLWALQKYSCSHQYNMLGIKGHPLSPIISQLLSGIIELGTSPSDLYPILEKTGLLPPDHNIHWEQSCLEYEIPKDIENEAQKILGTVYHDAPQGENFIADSKDNNLGLNHMKDEINLMPIKKQLPDGSYMGDRIEFNHSQMALAIDSADTTEIDDALYVDPDDPNSPYWSVHVHVADPTAWIPRNSLLEEWCSHRTSSIYVPEAKAPMLPPSLLDPISLGSSFGIHAATLALTFSFKVKKETGEIFLGELFDPHQCIRPSIIRSVKRLTYDKADALIEANDLSCYTSRTLSLLFKISKALSLKRGSISPHHLLTYIQAKPSPEVLLEGPKENPGSVIRIINGNDPSSSSQLLVSELMVATGVVAAIVAQYLHIPVPFRIQESPNTAKLESVANRIKTLSSKKALSSQLMNIVGSHLVLSSGLLATSKVSLVSGAHWSMGLSAYVRVTSPMRRYADMFTHFQIKSALSDRNNPLVAPDLINQLNRVNELEPQLKSLQRRAIRFWILTFVLRQSPNTTWDAIVLSCTKTTSTPNYSVICQVYILELFSSFSIYLDACMLNSFKGSTGDDNVLESGTRIQVTAGAIKRDINQATWYIATVN